MTRCWLPSGSSSSAFAARTSRKDGEHASPCGSYLTAATLAALLCGADKLDLLSDRGCDFAVTFEGGDGLPAAEEDLGRCEIALDGEKAARLREAVKARL